MTGNIDNPRSATVFTGTRGVGRGNKSKEQNNRREV